MNPVLIFSNTDKIRDEKTSLNNCVPLLQAVYNAFSAKGITVTIQDLVNFVQWTKSSNTPSFLEDFVADQLVTKAAPAAMFNGVQLQRDKLRSLIVLPDLTGIPPLLRAVVNRDNLNIRPKLLSLTNNVISKVPDADAQLEAEYSYYTKTDAGAQLATKVIAVCDALNGFYEDMVAEGQQYRFGHDNEFLFPAIKVMNNKTFVPNLYWFQKNSKL